MKVAAIIVTLLLIGVALVVHSQSLAPYTDEDAFNAKYGNMSYGQSKEFYELRNEMITGKFRIYDTGITFIALAVLFLAFSLLGGRNIKSPGSKLVLYSYAVILPVLTTAAFVFELFQSLDRGEFPSWADSIQIPLMVVPAALFAAIIWGIAHAALPGQMVKTNVSNGIFLSKHQNKWLMSISVTTAIFICEGIYYAYYWYVMPAFLWLYFYLSVAAIRRNNIIATGVGSSQAEVNSQK